MRALCLRVCLPPPQVAMERWPNLCKPWLDFNFYEVAKGAGVCLVSAAHRSRASYVYAFPGPDRFAAAHTCVCACMCVCVCACMCMCVRGQWERGECAAHPRHRGRRPPHLPAGHPEDSTRCATLSPAHPHRASVCVAVCVFTVSVCVGVWVCVPPRPPDRLLYATKDLHTADMTAAQYWEQLRDSYRLFLSTAYTHAVTQSRYPSPCVALCKRVCFTTVPTAPASSVCVHVCMHVCVCVSAVRKRTSARRWW